MKLNYFFDSLVSRLAAIPLSITVIVIAFVVHISDPFEDMELALLYLAAFVMISLAGPGRYSFDAVISAKLQIKVQSPLSQRPGTKEELK